MPTFLFSATGFFVPNTCRQMLFKSASSSQIQESQTNGGGLYLHLWMFSSPKNGVTPIFHCAVGQLRLNKSLLRHKVKPIELIFSPPKKNITFCFAECVFQQPSHLFLMEESQIFCNSTINKLILYPRAAPHPAISSLWTHCTKFTLFSKKFVRIYC